MQDIVEAQLSRPEYESRHTETSRTYLASCYCHSSGEKREAADRCREKKVSQPDRVDSEW